MSPGAPFAYTHSWALQPGEYEVNIVVEDVSKGVLGATKTHVVITENRTTEWQTGDLMLIAQDGRGSPRPVVDGRLQSGSQLAAYLEVVGGEEPSLVGEIFDATGEERLAELPMLRLVGDAAGVCRGRMDVGSLPVGEYMSQLRAIDRIAGQHRVFRERLFVR